MSGAASCRPALRCPRWCRGNTAVSIPSMDAPHLLNSAGLIADDPFALMALAPLGKQRALSDKVRGKTDKTSIPSYAVETPPPAEGAGYADDYVGPEDKPEPAPQMGYAADYAQP